MIAIFVTSILLNPLINDHIVQPCNLLLYSYRYVPTYVKTATYDAYFAFAKFIFITNYVN